MKGDLAQFHKSEVESVHHELFRLHDDLTKAAKSRIVNALKTMHLLEVGSYEDTRAEARVIIAELETLRDGIDELWMKASHIRTEMIRRTGCDGDHKEIR